MTDSKGTIRDYRLVVGEWMRRGRCVAVASLFIPALNAWALICAVRAVPERTPPRWWASMEAGIHVVGKSLQWLRWKSSSSAAAMITIQGWMSQEIQDDKAGVQECKKLAVCC